MTVVQSPVPILQNSVEFAAMLDLYRAAAPKRVLEIGTYHGGTLYHWLQNATDGATIVTVDSYRTGVDNRDLYPHWTPDGVTLHVIDGDSRDPNTVAQVALKEATIACKAEARGKKVKWLARRKYVYQCVAEALKGRPSMDIWQLRKGVNMKGLQGQRPGEWGCDPMC